MKKQSSSRYNGSNAILLNLGTMRKAQVQALAAREQVSLTDWIRRRIDEVVKKMERSGRVWDAESEEFIVQK